jgi:hypothetical protein
MFYLKMLNFNEKNTARAYETFLQVWFFTILSSSHMAMVKVGIQIEMLTEDVINVSTSIRG